MDDPLKTVRGRRGHTAVLVALTAFEAIHFRDARKRISANPSAMLAEMRSR